MVLLFLVGCGDDKKDSVEVLVRVNGVLQHGAILKKDTLDGVVVDAQAFASKVPGLLFYEMSNPPFPGMVLQYGKTISFVSAGFASGFCSLGGVTMEPPLEIMGGVYWTPLNFLAEAISGQVELESGGTVIAVSMPEPSEIGDIVPQAQAIARQLEREFIVRQGEISLASAIELYTAGYTPDCNGNNATNPYLVVQDPPSPRSDRFNRVPFGIQMDQDEAFVWVGNTPPECKYFSYQHYLMTRYYFEGDNTGATKVYARLGDSINTYNIRLGSNPFREFFVLIITGNQEIHDKLVVAVQQAGIGEDRILSLVLPDDVRFGLEVEADVLNLLHRASLFDRDSDKEAYTSNPTLEILRVTPRAEETTLPLEPPVPRDRRTGVREQDTAELGTLLDRDAAFAPRLALHGGLLENEHYARQLRAALNERIPDWTVERLRKDPVVGALRRARRLR